MSMVAIILSLTGFSGTQYAIQVNFVDPANAIYDQERVLFTDQAAQSFPILVGDAQTAVLAFAASSGYTLTSSQIVWGTLGATNRAFNFGVTRSFTTSTGAAGFQVSGTQDSVANYGVTVTSTASISGGQDGTVLLEVASTNSALSTDWKEVARCRNGQTYTLAIALQGIGISACTLSGSIPSGYYAKLRTVSTTGAPSFTYNSGQETLQ